MADINNSIKFERVTLWVSTQTYDLHGNAVATGLDAILDTLNEHLDGECKVLAYDTDEYQLVPVPVPTDEEE